MLQFTLLLHSCDSPLIVWCRLKLCSVRFSAELKRGERCVLLHKEIVQFGENKW